MTEPLRAALGLRTVVSQQVPSGVVLTRQARKEGKPVAIIRIVRYEQYCTVEAQVFPRGGTEGEAKAGPYRFSTIAEASAFVDEAVESLTYLGCEFE